MNKKLVAAAVASALAMPMAAQAVKYSASGQVNRAILVADDGVDSDVLHVDGDASSTRFRFTGSEDIGNGLTAGTRLEIQCESNDSFSVSVRQNSDTDSCASLRHAEVYFSGDFGKLSLGQSSDATDGIAFADLNNAWIPVENASDFGGGLNFRTASGAVTGISAGAVTPSYDGGRRDRVRYDTPSIGPLSLAITHATDSQVDIGAIAAGSVAGGAYDLRVGWRNHDSGGQDDGTVVVSGAFKFAQGTSIAAAWGEKSEIAGPGSGDGSYYYIKLGHDWGNNSIAADYKSSEDSVTVAAGCTGGTATHPACGGTSWGLGAVHTMPKANVDIYAGYRFFELDDVAGGISVEDINVFFVGSRIKFD
ncbi:MAG TPA: porin [Gammaproteobacteria bacterium]|nr:porin [Gammaproteobacteria bacterium]